MTDILDQTPIEHLVRTRTKELRIEFPQLLHRAGILNISKGLRRLEQLFGGDFVSSRRLIEGLPVALELPAELIREALESTTQKLQDRADREFRESFKPNLYILTGERGRPKKIFAAGLCNSDQYVSTSFPNSIPSTDYLAFALKFLSDNLTQINCFYYDPERIVINWTPDHASAYSVEGTHIEEFDRAIVPGRITVKFK